MKRLTYIIFTPILLWPTVSYSGWFGPSNYWECILDEMPGIKNDPAAFEIVRKCNKEFPRRPPVKKKSPVIGVKTAGECVIEYARDVSSHRGAKLIRFACYILYTK